MGEAATRLITRETRNVEILGSWNPPMSRPNRFRYGDRWRDCRKRPPASTIEGEEFSVGCGRALIERGSSNDYFRQVVVYVQLNPVASARCTSNG